MSSPLPSLLWGHQLDQAGPVATAWLWQGYLAPGNVTLLTGPPKGGKSTLLALLLHELRRGGTLMGQAVRPGKAVVISEESPAHWQRRGQSLGLAEQVGFVCRPFPGKPSAEQWRQLLEQLLALHQAHPLDLVVIDPLAAFLPGHAESQAALMLESLLPLHRLSVAGLAVLLLHHPSKQEQALGLSARGSGALAAFADLLLELRRPRDAGPTDRRRLLVGLSRHTETPAGQLVELNEAGTAYAPVAEPPPADEPDEEWLPLDLVLQDATTKLTRAQIEEDWPPDFPRPAQQTLWRWLERATAEGRVCRSGTGRRSDPFRYWLPGKEATLEEDSLARLLDEERELLHRLRTER